MKHIDKLSMCFFYIEKLGIKAIEFRRMAVGLYVIVVTNIGSLDIRVFAIDTNSCVEINYESKYNNYQVITKNIHFIASDKMKFLCVLKLKIKLNLFFDLRRVKYA